MRISTAQKVIADFRQRRACWLHGLFLLLAAIVMNGTAPDAALAVEEAQAAQGPPYNVHVLVSSRTDTCYDSGEVAAIKRMTLIEQDRINRRGGVSGRPIKLNFLDDERDLMRATGNVRTALADPQALALIGLSNATRGKGVFDALGPDILKSGIPFLSDISVNSIFAAYPNVYTTRASQDADNVPVIAQFTRQVGYAHPAFVGTRDGVGSMAMGDGLRMALGEGGLVADIRVAAENNKISQEDVAAIAAGLKDKRPDIVYLYIGGDSVPAVITELVANGLTPALFLGGRIDSLPAEIANAYPNALYSLAWDRPPEVFNDRMRSLITPANAQSWIFEGRKVAAAPGWAKGECKPRVESEVPDPFSNANVRAIGIGSQYADMVGLVAEAAQNDERSTDPVRLRSEVLKGLKTKYSAGHGAFKGAFDTWSFVPSSRSAARDPFVIILPQGLGRTQLAPIQFIRSKDGSLRQMDTLYADVDLIKAHRVSENDKSFYAEFYLSLRDNAGASIDRIEFANAYLDDQGARQVSVATVHPGGKSAAYPDTMKIYKVSGRFLFDPDLANYPFDMQRFAIDLQPKTGESPFIVQPPPLDLRDTTVETDGWTQKAQYVGYGEDFVPVIDAYTHEPSIVPFYKSSFAWLMQREATDYFLRVAVPLGFILFVAYLSIFIPKSHFEAIVTIQVTALLSAVALYLSLQKFDTGSATLSDRAFVFAYMILSLMIGISILRVHPRVGGIPRVEQVLQALHIAAVPAFVAVAAYYVYGLSTAMG
jgi:ABC-type branched-subunit amino acid transport system substrate-binding protein